MKDTETKKVLQEAEERLKKHGDGKGALGTPPVPTREGVTHGPAGTGPTPRKPTR
jgi:hypothetical protein